MREWSTIVMNDSFSSPHSHPFPARDASKNRSGTPLVAPMTWSLAEDPSLQLGHQENGIQRSKRLVQSTKFLWHKRPQELGDFSWFHRGMFFSTCLNHSWNVEWWRFHFNHLHRRHGFQFACCFRPLFGNLQSWWLVGSNFSCRKTNHTPFRDCLVPLISELGVV